MVLIQTSPKVKCSEGFGSGGTWSAGQKSWSSEQGSADLGQRQERVKEVVTVPTVPGSAGVGYSGHSLATFVGRLSLQGMLQVWASSFRLGYQREKERLFHYPLPRHSSLF